MFVNYLSIKESERLRELEKKQREEEERRKKEEEELYKDVEKLAKVQKINLKSSTYRQREKNNASKILPL